MHYNWDIARDINIFEENVIPYLRNPIRRGGNPAATPSALADWGYMLTNPDELTPFGLATRDMEISWSDSVLLALSKRNSSWEQTTIKPLVVLAKYINQLIIHNFQNIFITKTDLTKLMHIDDYNKITLEFCYSVLQNEDRFQSPSSREFKYFDIWFNALSETALFFKGKENNVPVMYFNHSTYSTTFIKEVAQLGTNISICPTKDNKYDYYLYQGSLTNGIVEILPLFNNTECASHICPTLCTLYKNKSKILTTNQPLQQIYYGAPGTGKSHTIDGVVTEDNSVRTTFHPDSDYASFVGAYKPTMGNIKISVLVGKEIQYALPQEGHPGTEQKIVYKYVPQAFLKAYVEAWKRYNPEKDEPFYLVIEEINRGNCAQIFGDLFQLLDRNNMGSSSYPISADDDIEQFLATDEKGFVGLTEEQKEVISNFILVKDNDKTENIGESILNGKKLLLPPNLRIWATMNTSDQSLFPIDSAFKRRWDWKYMPIEYNPKDHNGNIISWTFEIGKKQYSWGAFLEKINPEIYTLTESSDKQMGYFFAKADPQTGIISEDVFLNKVLFYLWTDVFKDYDVSSEIFKNKKKNRSFRFTDFFEDPEALGSFIENLGLKPIGGQDDTNEDASSEESKSSLKFKVGESFPIPQRKLALTALEQYVNNNPDITAEELITEWEPLSNVPHFIESEEEHQKTIATATSFEERTQKVELQNGDIVYVSLHGWIPKTSQEFMDAVNAKDWGIDISILSE